MADSVKLPDRWYPLRHHAGQSKYFRSTVRFNVSHSGRRSGKTEIGKRRVVLRSLAFSAFPDGFFIAGAPTLNQARTIFWNDLKALTPREAMARDPKETDLSIQLVTGTEIRVLGMDVPERAEGRPIDGGILDEYGNMKAKVWTQHLRPALSTTGRPGWMDFTGVPEGRNHYYDLAKMAESDSSGDWMKHWWPSADIIDPKELEAARRDLDELTFDQEMNGSFISFQGRAYYPFDSKRHCYAGLFEMYSRAMPLIVCLDFNTAPGVAVICQEMRIVLPGFPLDVPYTAVIGEVHIPQNSNTPMVCKKIINDWGDHTGEIHLYGDATGGAVKSSSVAGSDWDLVRAALKPKFGDKLRVMVGKSNPPERNRVNSMNTRLLNGAGMIRLLVDPRKAPNTVKDFEGVQVVAGGSGELDKKKDEKLTHLTDGLGYYVHDKYPAGGAGFGGVVQLG